MNEVLVTVLNILSIFLSVFVAIFLFWRACRHELFDNEQIFDIVLIGGIGGLILGRVVGFLLNFSSYGLSVYKFLFFHVYPAFNFWGFIIGAFLAISIFLRHKRTSAWAFFDLAAAPIVFGLFLAAATSGLIGFFRSGISYQSLVLSAVYFVFFFILKRLATKKRHVGFFACIFLVICPILNVVYWLVLYRGQPTKIADLYYLAFLCGVSIIGAFFWHRLAGRKFSADSRLIFGFFFLRLLGFLRAIGSADEAGRIAHTVIFFPYSILKAFLLLLRSLIREIKLGFVEFFYILGIRR